MAAICIVGGAAQAARSRQPSLIWPGYQSPAGFRLRAIGTASIFDVLFFAAIHVGPPPHLLPRLVLPPRPRLPRARVPPPPPARPPGGAAAADPALPAAVPAGPGPALLAVGERPLEHLLAVVEVELPDAHLLALVELALL